jgi:hypothetical protein
MTINATGAPVLCESHKGVHGETVTCKYPHLITPSGRTWATGLYAS